LENPIKRRIADRELAKFADHVKTVTQIEPI
jgi:hypothetical protein